VAPAGFTRVTGQAHWEVLVRARAIENQVYVIAPCSCGTTAPTRDFFGHSMIVSPWGEVLAERAEGEGVVLADLDMEALAAARKRLPVLEHRRLGLQEPALLV
jgi:nitrilase